MHCTVIGGGLIGITTAWFLRQAGCTVTLLERGEALGAETSFANGGMLHASQASPWNEPGVIWQALKNLGREDAALLIRPRAVPRMLGWTWAFFRNSSVRKFQLNLEKNTRLADYSLAVLNEHLSALNLNFVRQDNGTLKIYRTAAELDAATRVAARGSDWGIRYHRLDPRQVMQLEPALAPIESVISGGIHFPDDISGDANLFCNELANQLTASGGDIRLNTRVEAIEIKQGAVCGVRTEHEVLESDVCVVAAASYSPALLATCGLRLPVQPIKGYSLTVPIGAGEIKPRVPVIDEHYHAAVCPLGDRLRVAGTAEFAGFDRTLTRERINNLYQLLTHVYPELSRAVDRSTVKEWSGLRPMSPDGVGIMGGTPVPGLYVNTGHGHLGWTMAPAAGKLVADLVCGEQPELELQPYALERFGNGK